MGTIANVKVEPCSVEWNASGLGFTDGDIEIKTEEMGVEITAHQEGQNVLDMIRTGKKVELELTLKETSVAQIQAALGWGGGSTAGEAQTANLTCVADVSSSLHGATFPLIAQDGTQYLFQLKTGALVAPVIQDWNVVQVSISANDGANAVADAVASAIDALAGFAAPNPAAAVIAITWADAGEVAAGSGAGNTGFTFAVTNAGSSDLVGWGNSNDFTSMLGDAAKLVLHPVANDDTDYSGDLAFWKAYPMLGSIKQSGENPKMVSVSFKIFPDTAKADEIRLFAYGDHT